MQTTTTDPRTLFRTWTLQALTALGVGTALVLFAASTSTASAAPPCAKASYVKKHLAEKFNEEPIAFGFQTNGSLLQVYHSEEKDTWTVVTTSPQGKSCIVAAGKNWKQLPVLKGLGA